MDFFKSFKVSKPEFALLAEGEHIVRLLRIEPLNSFQQYNGQPKDELPEWANATPQLAATVVAAEEGKNGGLTHRFNGCGYRKYDELSEKEIKSGKYENIEGYACHKDADGDIVREEDPDRTQSCANIINQFAAAMRIEEGEELMPALEKAIQDQVLFRVTVINDPYDGKDQLRLTRYRSVSAVAVEDDFED
jgi:hypothetical protein